MKTRAVHRQPSALRGALTLTWDLNVRAIPTALVWAVSLMFIFQAPNVKMSLACSIVCSAISLLNVSIVKFSHIRVKPLVLVKTREFQQLLLLNILVGSLFVLALSNVLNLNPSSIWISLALTSIALTLLIAWMGLMLIFNPIFVSKVATQATNSTAQLFIMYVQNRKREVVLVGVIMVVFAPFIFIFIAIALTLTQALTLLTLDELTSKSKIEAEIQYG